MARQTGGMASLELIFGIIGGISGGSAIVATASGLLRSRRDQQVRTHLKLQLNRLRRLNRRITAITVVLNRKLSANPQDGANLDRAPKIDGDLMYLDSIVIECEETVAHLRSLDAEGGLERLRIDVETLAARMGEAAAIYRESVAAMFEPPASLAAVGIPVVGPKFVEDLEELKRDTLSLFRTCAHRYGLEQGAADPIPVLWPVRASDLEGLPPEQELWGSEPQPMS